MRERQREREAERQRDRETERQRDRETERQRDRETERQRDRETERQRDRETERQTFPFLQDPVHPPSPNEGLFQQSDNLQQLRLGDRADAQGLERMNVRAWPLLCVFVNKGRGEKEEPLAVREQTDHHHVKGKREDDRTPTSTSERS